MNEVITTVIKQCRVLSLIVLIFYGIIPVLPVDALLLFGHANRISRRHAVTAILPALMAIVFTAAGYGGYQTRTRRWGLTI